MKTDDKTRLVLSGQVNRGILITDDDENSNVFFVDNDNSSTRINLTGKTRFNQDIAVGGVIEVQFESNSTAEVSQDNSAMSAPTASPSVSSRSSPVAKITACCG